MKNLIIEQMANGWIVYQERSRGNSFTGTDHSETYVFQTLEALAAYVVESYSVDKNAPQP